MFEIIQAWNCRLYYALTGISSILHEMTSYSMQ